jgi:hypothetical protein
VEEHHHQEEMEEHHQGGEELYLMRAEAGCIIKKEDGGYINKGGVEAVS